MSIALEGKEPWLGAAATLLHESGCVIKKYRTNLTGGAYTHSAEWWIEVPYPTTALRFGIFAHEVGHQMLHRVHKRRWVEEAEAWRFALECFDRFDLPYRDTVQARANRSVKYALGKSIRRGGSPDLALIATLGFGHLADAGGVFA